jgi:hypothetical protein
LTALTTHEHALGRDRASRSASLSDKKSTKQSTKSDKKSNPKPIKSGVRATGRVCKIESNSAHKILN